jgi:predicted secreted protein
MPHLEERYEVRRAAIDTAASGDQTVVAAITGKRITVVAYTLVVTNATSLPRWKSGANNISGAMAVATNGSVSASSSAGVLATNPGEALILNNATATQLSGHLTYTVS